MSRVEQDERGGRQLQLEPELGNDKFPAPAPPADKDRAERVFEVLRVDMEPCGNVAVGGGGGVNAARVGITPASRVSSLQESSKAYVRGDWDCMLRFLEWLTLDFPFILEVYVNHENTGLVC